MSWGLLLKYNVRLEKVINNILTLKHTYLVVSLKNGFNIIGKDLYK